MLAQVSLHIWAGSSEPLLLIDEMSTQEKVVAIFTPHYKVLYLELSTNEYHKTSFSKKKESGNNLKS